MFRWFPSVPVLSSWRASGKGKRYSGAGIRILLSDIQQEHLLRFCFGNTTSTEQFLFPTLTNVTLTVLLLSVPRTHRLISVREGIRITRGRKATVFGHELHQLKDHFKVL